MASPAVLTPVKSRTSVLSSRTAGGRMPLTPSPHTPRSQTLDVQAHESIHGGNLMARFQRSISKKSMRDSPKSNIAKTSSPRRLDLGVSEWSLTGSGKPTTAKVAKPVKATKTAKTPKAKKDNLRPRPTKTRITYNSADRFIPNRTASEAICNVGTGKIDLEQRPKSSSKAEGSTVLASAASAFDLGGRGSEEDVALSLEGLTLDDDEEDSQPRSKAAPETAAYQSTLASACGINTNTRILAFKPAAPESSRPIDLRSQYNRPLRAASSVNAQSRRRIPSAPERVLDAPGLVDDYYLNLLDWSSGNQVAIGLERSVYVWSADSGSVASLFECAADTYISSVKWSGDGAYVGVGLGTGEVQIWDVEEQTKLRSMFGHETRVGVMGWNKHLLSTGARSGLVYNHDVRIAQHKVAELVSHTGEVCGLEWRADGAQLATGGNDNMVNIWDARSLTAPKFTKTNHRAAVKALAWCPWQSNLLATGGGSNDRQIYFWNTTTGARINHIATDSQVTSLRWSTHYKEIVSSGGFPDNSLSIWSYPTGVKNMEIPAHESRVLHSCLSPDGQMLATAAADESLKFWKVFEKKPGQPSVAAAGSASMKPSATKQMTIR
ncbi:meiosis-specific APC/C activator protein AMA1 [Dothidotthia symphoricarpi CBS 119687]|uniref:Meiosis-specific APC/C activator protein AMA1 n=1 Tax=Dothidotthia symphoricarpi CBS 119687 TaxID=1392245 RepID=A0A6A6AAU6_9PLEO|nr:meiosis-specific APC/C activator protein AMA1 [Dothidotthia symphoricarpi CBS 119687]KAF2127998.1 meiosis-specific APC/C activator protein AMA1 [Dothidotthia symphoricarpi CBS 119687]